MVRPQTVATAALLLLLLATGCARNRFGPGEGGLRSISEVEIRKSGADDVLELIQDLRPSWLMGGSVLDPTDPTETGGPGVLINDVPMRPLLTLQFMSVENVREVRYLTGTSAEIRYRVRVPEGLIVVLTYANVGPGDSIRPDTGRAPHPMAR